MRLICILTLITFSMISCTSPNQKDGIETKEVKYSANGKEMIGFLAKPAHIKKEAPGILVVHEWWGQTDYPRERAIMLAELGYIAFAVDMYGDRQLTDHPSEAGKFAKAVLSDANTVGSRFAAALDALKKQSKVNKNKIGAIGYCFGGSVVLEMARQGADLAGVVSFHGGLLTPTKARRGQTKSKILVLNGSKDPFIKKEHIKAFKKEMRIADVEYDFVNYENALHGFTNPMATEKGKSLNLPLAYNKEADEKSWIKMKEFFNSIF